jgi:hypothetical protein
MNNEIKKSLYGNLADLQFLENATDYLDSSDTQAHGIALANLEIVLREKVDSVVFFKEMQEDSIELLDKRIKELTEIKKMAENKLERFEKYVDLSMQTFNVNELIGKNCSLKRRTPSKVVAIKDEKLVPIEFLKIIPQSYTIDKASIAKLLKAGEIVDGCQLVDGKSSIIFKVR